MENELPLAKVQPEGDKMFALIERMSTDPQCDPAKLKEILSVKQTWEADEARKAFAADMATFQSRCPIITKGEEAYGKRYARIDRIHRETRALRQECGFWFTWQSCECDMKTGVARLEGTLGHRQGHTVPIKQVIPLPDELKGQNPTQRAGSAMTYAKRYGECLALDIVTGEDDDGGGGNRPKPVIDASRPVSSGDEIKRLSGELWRILLPVRGTERNWKMANRWMIDEMILNPDEEAPQLGESRFREVIETATKKLPK